jgi:hypothetical protein
LILIAKDNESSDVLFVAEHIIDIITPGVKKIVEITGPARVLCAGKRISMY